jgi:HEPN domain-containing protein
LIYEIGNGCVLCQVARISEQGTRVVRHAPLARRSWPHSISLRAQALIFERTGKVIKRHRGVQRELARLVKDEPRFDMELRAFLGRTYNLKAIADYETDPGSQVTFEQAQEAINTAERLVGCIGGP